MLIEKEQSIVTLVGNIPGPTTTILVGVHGNECSGPVAVQELLNGGYTIDTGTLHVVFANLQGLVQQKRYIDVNMNRCFGQSACGYEAERVKEIIPYLQQSDYLLDVHNTIDLSTPPFIICEHDELLLYFGVQRAVRGLDELHRGGSDGYMNSIGKKAVCLEVGSIVDDLKSTVAIAKQCIENFLSAIGNKKQKAMIYKLPLVMSCRRIYHAQYGSFTLEKQFSEFEFVNKGTLLGIDGSVSVYMPEDGSLLFSRNTYEIGEECFVVVQKL